MKPRHKVPALLIATILLSAGNLLAGEYGLTVKDSASEPCDRSVQQSLNTCTSGAVVKDLNEHYLAGKPFQLAAVASSLPAGRVYFASGRERQAVCLRLAELLASSGLHEPADLERTVIATNYATMFQALDSVRSRPSLTVEARSRLARVYARHPRSPLRASSP